MNFEKLRKEVQIEDVARWLGITLAPKNGKYRARCPLCESESDRSFVITPKCAEHDGLFYCFSCEKGGGTLKLVSLVKRIEYPEAGMLLSDEFSLQPQKRAQPTEAAGECPELKYLKCEHDALTSYGLTKDTCLRWGIGFAPIGTMQNHVVIPIFKNGKRLAYVGYKKGEPLKFPKNFTGKGVIFNADNATSDPIHVARTPLSAVLAIQNGLTNVVSFVGDTTLEDLAALVQLMQDRTIAEVAIE